MGLSGHLAGDCPGGLCNYLVLLSELIVVLLLIDGFIFLVTLIPPLFSWKSVQADSKKRIFFALFACVTFYLWLTLLAIHSFYCFGFLAHSGPCSINKSAVPTPVTAAAPAMSGSIPLIPALPEVNPRALEPEDIADEGRVEEAFSNLSATAEALVDKCVKDDEDSSLRNMTLVNILILVVLLITIAANVNEVLNAKSLYHCETLCRREDLQGFLSSLTGKRPEVGHIVKCFHTSKSPDTKTNSVHKVVTYSSVDNFQYQTWKDFSDLRLIDPSQEYPVIEVEVLLNFFPGDHVTADKYKHFVQQLTKLNSGKDHRITIDDYFHIEDQREWTFFIGNRDHIVPWWERDPARIILSCVFMVGWPFRFSYKGQVAKHRLEVKKAVFCENTSQDEGVSLSATPGSSTDGGASSKIEVEVDTVVFKQNGNEKQQTDPADSEEPLSQEHVVNVQVSSPPSNHTCQQREDRSTPLLNRHNPGNHPLRSAPLASPRTHLRETTKDIVTAVTHHDINGMNAVSTVALKDIDVQMTALSGYETYV